MSAGQREQLRAASATAQVLLDRLNGIIDLSKIEAGRLAFEEVPFEVARVVESCLQPEILRAHEKGLALNWNVARDVPRYVMGDPARFRQILLNLVNNAVKFTSHGSVTVQLRCYDCDGAKELHGKPHELMIVVSDTGRGIPADKQKVVFEKFEQVDESISRKFGGCGLGLAIIRRLVELHHGSVAVESEVDRGSQFTVILPYEPAAAPSAVPASARPDHDNTRAVLVVEDNVVNQKVVTALLQKHGYDTEVATDGQQALDKLARRQFALVLMDVQMPVMDGLETTRRIRSEARWANLPIVAMTAHAMSGDRERCLQAGMNSYLAKPVNHLHLLSVVARYCRAAEESSPAMAGTAGPSLTSLHMHTVAR